MPGGMSPIGSLNNPQDPTQSIGASYIPYDPNSSTMAQSATNAQTNNNTNYQNFMNNLPGFQNQLNNQALDQGAGEYNSQKQAIDQNANARGLLYSGLKQGAEAGAAVNAANKTQSQIATNNQNMQNYASGYGTQVANTGAANYQGAQNAYLNQTAASQKQQAQNNAMLGQGLMGAASIGAMMLSDEDAKDDIKEGDEPAQEFVDKMNSKTFKYKDGGKKQLGILAQDVEKSPMGKAMIVETDKGKAIDIPKALSAVMAVQSVLNKKLKRVSG